MKILKKKIVCALAVLFAVFFAACSDDLGSGTGAGFTSEEDDPSSYIAEKIVPIKNKTVSGYAQKGPFKAGSIVDIYELELDGKTFAQTGKSFTGKVANDKGEFKIPNVSLKSQYALLKVTGYFTSEINGEGVRATLTAVTDLSKRENVNVNILTHLEYDRVLALLGKGMNFTSAKKQAGREVLAAFGIGLEESTAAEALDVSGESEADAALVAISKLVLAGEKEGTNRDEADLAGLLARIAGSIGEKGDWVDVSGYYVPEEPREGICPWVNKWNMARRISDLYRWDGESCSESLSSMEEKYLYQFYISWEYVGQSCTASLEGEIVIDSVYHRGLYYCKDGEWRYVGEEDYGIKWCQEFIEEEGYGLGIGKDGEIRKGDKTGLNYKYDEKMGKWREIDVLDTLLSTVCTEKHHGEVAKYKDSVYYICDKSGWRKMTEEDVDEGNLELCSIKNRGVCAKFYNSFYCCDSNGWRGANEYEVDVGTICLKDGEIKKGLTDVSYKCDEKKGIWLPINESDTLFSTVCTSTHGGEFAISEDSSLYVCVDHITYSYWARVTSLMSVRREDEEMLGTCSITNRGSCTKIFNLFICCDSSGWRDADEYEADVGTICSKDGEIKNGSTGVSYKCDEKKGKWLIISEYDTLFSTVCTSNHYNELQEMDFILYVCGHKGIYWNNVADFLSSTCSVGDTASWKTWFSSTQTFRFICVKKNTWRLGGYLDSLFGVPCNSCNSSNRNCEKIDDVIFGCVCPLGGEPSWRAMDDNSVRSSCKNKEELGY